MLPITVSKENVGHFSTNPFLHLNKILDKGPHIRNANYRHLGKSGHSLKIINNVDSQPGKLRTSSPHLRE